MPMPLLDRRRFGLAFGATLAAPMLAARTTAPAHEDGQHAILMLNADCSDTSVVNVFAPSVLHIEPGQSVTFLATDPGHNTASKRGMIPDGAEPWNGAIDEELTITLPVPGIYGYICLPHYEGGMVGLIVVGNDLSNLAAAHKVRHPGAARKTFRALLTDLEAGAA
ncbi:pseudoazurin [uncultured Roseobacter sp.]|uniref:pseudoazurin n=1 Tax=uncultured Roseobacter sp. TaxID=114847 RepID=UPI002623E30E|nr:pseudoazurin [uncultured Roseobacter sp.]